MMLFVKMTRKSFHLVLKGPHVIVDKLLEHIANLNMDGLFTFPLQNNPSTLLVHLMICSCLAEMNMTIKSGENAAESRQIDAGTRLSIDVASGKKRRIGDANGEESDGDDAAPPTNDIYRQRQQKKVAR